MLYKGDCLEILKGIPDGSVDAVVADPLMVFSTVPRRNGTISFRLNRCGRS